VYDPICHVWLLRHGERVDEVSWKWHDDPINSTYEWWDPPLTKKGKVQAVAAGKLLKTIMEQQEFKFETIAVSPLSRTLMTAECVTSEINQDVQVIAGVSECCAVVEAKGIAAMIPEFPPLERIQEICPNLNISDYQLIPESFSDTATRLAIPGKHILLVTHREGIRLFKKTIQNIPYCLTVHFMYNVQTQKWAIAEQYPIKL